MIYIYFFIFIFIYNVFVSRPWLFDICYFVKHTFSLDILNNKLVESAKMIGAGSATVGVAGAGVGIGSIFSGFLTAFSRNPSLKKDLFVFTLLGFALTEAIALFALMMSFLILFL